MPSLPSPMPVLFVSHGAPTKALDLEAGAALAAWAHTLPRPKGILVVSAHWWEREVQISSSDVLPTLHDFAGFGPELLQIQYPARGFSNELRALVQTCLAVPEVERGLDHGAWVPLLHMFPDADIPVLPLALRLRGKFPSFFELGQTLAPLRQEGILILASGSATHNLGIFFEDGPDIVPDWVTAFDLWLQQRLEARDKDSLIEPRFIQPLFRKNHPTNDHYAPLLVALGAAWDSWQSVHFPIQGIEHKVLSKLCVEFR